MKIITPILLISIYFLSLLGPGLKAFNCCGETGFISVSSLKKEDRKDASFKTNCHSFKIKDAHITPSAIKVPGSSQTQTAKIFNTSTVLQQLFPHTTINSFLSQKNFNQAYSVVPAYVYGCVFRI